MLLTVSGETRRELEAELQAAGSDETKLLALHGKIVRLTGTKGYAHKQGSITGTH